MNFANPETTNLLLLVMTLVAVSQFVILIGVLLALRSATQRAHRAFSAFTGGDLHQIHGRMTRLLVDVERLVAHGNTVLGAVERGAQDLGTAAAAVSSTAQQALAVSSSEVRAVRSAVKTGFRWIVQTSPWLRRVRARQLQPLAPQPHGLQPAPRTY